MVFSSNWWGILRFPQNVWEVQPSIVTAAERLQGPPFWYCQISDRRRAASLKRRTAKQMKKQQYGDL